MSIDYSNTRRNDPCPCGSGKKYKKCCFHNQIIQAQTERETLSLETFIEPGQDAYQWFKGIRQITNRRDWRLLYEAFAADSPILGRYPSAESFIVAARESADNAPLGGDLELRRFRLLGDTTWIMVARGLEDRRRTKVEFEVVEARASDKGLMITDFEKVEVAKVEGSAADPEFEAFTSVTNGYQAIAGEAWERPVVARWDPATEQMLNPDGSVVEPDPEEEAEETPAE